MSLATLFAIDLACIALVVFGLYVPRHHNRDMVVALLGINIGVLGVTQALSSAEISAGLGLGLFGVLSIIRLRSREMNQSDVAYYFVALTLGLLGGFVVQPSWVSPVLMAALVAAVAIGDHPHLLARSRQQIITLDRAYLDEADLRRRLNELLGGDIKRIDVRKTDLVDDTMVVDVRYRISEPLASTVGPAEYSFDR